MASINSFKSNTQLTTTEASMVESSSAEKKFLGKVTCTNTHSSSVIVTLWLVPTGTTLTTSNYTDKKSMQAGEVCDFPKTQTHVVDNEMTLYASADVDSVVNILISGVTES